MEEVNKFLIDNNIEYDVIKHDPVLTALPPIPEVIDLGYVEIKNIFLKSSKPKLQYFLVCTNIYTTFQIKNLMKILQLKKLSMVSREDVENLLKVQPGTISLLNVIDGEVDNVTVIIDEELISEEFFCYHPNRNDYTYAIKQEDIFKILKIKNVKFEIINIACSHEHIK